jgi:hypothetical protein
MSDSFSPLRIKNPSFVRQTAKVCPGQEIYLYLDNNMFEEHIVDVSTNFLNVEFIRNKSGDSVYRVCHSNSIHDWAEYSSSLLGEIWIDGKNSIAKIGVLLESKNQHKTQVTTVVNPDCFDLRIYPHNIIEVVVFDSSFGYHDEWKWDWIPIKDVEIEQIGYDHLCLHSWDSYHNGLESPNYLYARCPRTVSSDGLLTRQHHFWFRLNKNAFKLIAKESGIIQIGNIVINGLSNRYQLDHASKMSYHVSLYVDCRKKYYKKMQETLLVASKNNSLSEYNVIKKLPEIRDVDVKIMNSDFDGCRSVMTENEYYFKFNDEFLNARRHWY